MADDNVTSLKVVAKNIEDELIAALEQMALRADPIAKMRWAFYQAHLAQGFDRDQALMLCQNTRI